MNKLNDLTGKNLAPLHTLHSGRYQHIKLAGGIFAGSEGLGALRTWLDEHARRATRRRRATAARKTSSDPTE